MQAKWSATMMMTTINPLGLQLAISWYSRASPPVVPALAMHTKNSECFDESTLGEMKIKKWKIIRND